MKKIAMGIPLVFFYENTGTQILILLAIQFIYWGYIVITRPFKNVIIIIHHCLS
jgi:hypothetical protein